jgi:DNA-binding Xre family transcriptional regulator
MAEASQRIGVSRNRLSQLELNQADEFTRDEIARFCDFYSEVLGRTVSPGELIGYETDSDAESATNKKPALTLA